MPLRRLCVNADATVIHVISLLQRFSRYKVTYTLDFATVAVTGYMGYDFQPGYHVTKTWFNATFTDTLSLLRIAETSTMYCQALPMLLSCVYFPELVEDALATAVELAPLWPEQVLAPYAEAIA